ncbi:MAG: ACP S-malonyltransferase [Chloroflexi bacterium]|nr:ACP S-malonyltransferase [Chloroflexota bacterium]
MSIDWGTTAALFPGQGSQAVGMGADFAERYAVSRDTFAQADEILGYNLSRICWGGPTEALDQTNHTQPALYVSSVAIWRALQEALPGAQPAWMAGHSLGELSALTAAGALVFDAGLRLVQARGHHMQLAGEHTPGAMAAVLALELSEVEALCASASAETGKLVVLANDNCPGQAVVSGEIAAVNRMIELAKQAGARRAVKLAVSIAAHSPLMATALDGFLQVVEGTTFTPPDIPVISNVGAQPLTGPRAIRKELNQQLTQSVRWTDSMRAIIEAGAETFVEIGAGSVLTGLLRRIDRSKARVNLNSVEALERFLDSQA